MLSTEFGMIWEPFDDRFSRIIKSGFPRDPDPGEKQAKFIILAKFQMSILIFTVPSYLVACHHAFHHRLIPFAF